MKTSGAGGIAFENTLTGGQRQAASRASDNLGRWLENGEWGYVPDRRTWLIHDRGGGGNTLEQPAVIERQFVVEFRPIKFHLRSAERFVVEFGFAVQQRQPATLQRRTAQQRANAQLAYHFVVEFVFVGRKQFVERIQQQRADAERKQFDGDAVGKWFTHAEQFHGPAAASATVKFERIVEQQQRTGIAVVEYAQRQRITIDVGVAEFL